MITDKALEARHMNLITASFVTIAFAGIVTLGAVGKTDDKKKAQAAKVFKMSDRQIMERRRARMAQAVTASMSSQP